MAQVRGTPPAPPEDGEEEDDAPLAIGGPEAVPSVEAPGCLDAQLPGYL